MQEIFWFNGDFLIVELYELNKDRVFNFRNSDYYKRYGSMRFCYR